MQASVIGNPVATPAHVVSRFRRLCNVRCLLVVFVVLGLAARCRQYLSTPSYWYDEAFLMTNVFEKSFGQLIGPLDHEQVAPPLFLWTLRALYITLGPGELVMRFPAMAASVAALFLMIPLARRVVGSPSWIVAVGLCALSNHALAHAYQVKPYSTDLLVTELILLAALVYLDGRRAGVISIFFAALLGPWFSFPSAFVLGGVSMALFVNALRRRTRQVWLTWAGFNFTVLLSGLALWLVAARYHNSDYQRTAFGQFFVDLSSPIAAGSWIVQCITNVGHYGSTGIGVPLLLFSIAGVVVLWMRSRTVAALMVGPIVLALTAAALKQYPFGDRLSFFAVPCIWLLAATGIGELIQRLNVRWKWAGIGVAALTLLPGMLRTSLYAVRQEKVVQFREAFEYVRQHWQPGDQMWAGHPLVYRVYFGAEPPIMDCFTPGHAVEAAARSGRLWTVLPPRILSERYYPVLFESLLAAHAVPAASRQFNGIDIVLYRPSSAGE